jgi:RNA polymerase sigma factor (sigma-70 family)
METDDSQLLRQYASLHSEEAFRALADRYAGLVYHAALRQTGNPDLADEVTQAVFIALARKAGRIPVQTVLSGWLFQATRFAVLKLVRAEARRQLHQKETAAMQTAPEGNDADAAWDRISLHLDDALNALSKKDRDAVLIRFFQNKSHKEVARALGVSEDAAKMRVSRAIEKLRTIFAQRGVAAPSLALAAALAAHGPQAAPAGVASAVAAALSKGKAASSSTLTLTKGILKLMAWTKLKTAAVAAAGILLTAGTATVAVRHLPPLWEPSYQGQPVSHWIKVLNTMHSDPHGVSDLEGEQPILEIGRRAIPYLCRTLRARGNLPEKACAARGLGLFGPEAAAAVPDLIEALQDQDKWVRSAAASALGNIGPKARAAVPALIKRLNDPDTNFQLGYVIGLKGAAQDSPEVIPVYQKLLLERDSTTRSWIASALGEMKVEQEKAIKLLVDTLQDENDNVRGRAAASLGQIGPAAASAVPQLLRLLETEEQRADIPLSNIECWKILEALEKMGPAARAAVPMLTNHLNSADPIISAYAARALWAIEPHNALSIPCFMEKLTPGGDNSETFAQYWSLIALAKIGPEARAALPLVRNLLGQENPQNQMAAAVAAWKLDPSGPPPLDLLETTIHDRVHNRYRRGAIQLLGVLGPPARAAIPTLIEATKEPDALMRDDARAALQQVQAH